MGQRREELGLTGREAFAPQAYEWGAEAQVDWYEAVADVDGERRTAYGFDRSLVSTCAPPMRTVRVLPEFSSR